jgi:hypothetical protein
MVNVFGISQIMPIQGASVKQRRLKAVMGLSSIVIAAVVAAACGGGTEPTLDTQIGGAWHLVATVTDSLRRLATASPPFTYCTLTGNLAITQVASTFTGQLTGTTRTCTGPNASSGSWDGPVTEGLIVGHSISFRTTTLQMGFIGSDSTSPGTVISNYNACLFCLWWYLPPTKSLDSFYYGTWQLTR